MKELHVSPSPLGQWCNYGDPTPPKQSGLQTGAPCVVGSPDEVFEPCGPLRAWSRRKHTPRAAFSTRWMCLTMLITLLPYSSLSLGRWALLATCWLCSPSTGAFHLCVFGFSWLHWPFPFLTLSCMNYEDLSQDFFPSCIYSSSRKKNCVYFI